MEKGPRGTFDYACDTKNGLIVVRWNDNNVVNAVSSTAGIYPVQKTKRWSRSEAEEVGRWPVILCQTLQQDHGRSWLDGPGRRQVPHCHPLKEAVVAHLCILLGPLHSASLASAKAHAGSSEADQQSSSHSPHNRKSVPCPWSSSTLPRTSNRFCCISAPATWTNPLWQAGPPRSALAQAAKVCLLRHENGTQMKRVQGWRTWQMLHQVPHKVNYCLDQPFWPGTKLPGSEYMLSYLWFLCP